MNNEMSLAKMLNDPGLLFDNERLQKKINDVKKDKGNLTEAANNYNNRYKEEIEEGTKKRQLLISEGETRGLNEEESLQQYGRFVPCRRTPILNFLYFMLREENVDLEFEETRQKYNKEFGHLQEQYSIDDSDSKELAPPPDMESFIYGNLSGKEYQTIKKLKSLALSGECNEHESALAFTMCKKMCNKYGLDFSKIPVFN